MADGIGDVARASAVDLLINSYTNLFCELSTVEPGVNGASAVPVVGTGIVAVSTVPGDWGSAAVANPAVAANSSLLDFGTATAEMVGGAVVGFVGVWSHATSRTPADFIMCGTLGNPQAIRNTNPVTIAIGAITVSLSY